MEGRVKFFFCCLIIIILIILLPIKIIIRGRRRRRNKSRQDLKGANEAFCLSSKGKEFYRVGALTPDCLLSSIVTWERPAGLRRSQ